MTVKEKIIEQATALFLRSGIRAVTMDDISREAGVSKRTIYENFQDKDDLLRKCLDFLDEGFRIQHEQIVQESENTIQMVFGFLKLGIKAVNEINPLFLEDLKRYHLKVWKDVYKINVEKQRVQVLTILKKGINQDLFRKGVDVEIVTILLIEQLRLMNERSVFPREKYSQRVVFENVIINFFRGIATMKGLGLIDKMLSDESEFFITA